MNKRPLIVASLLVFSSVASAQALKPGLWEVTQKTQVGGGQMDAAMAQMQKEMANMPPEQRKMVEEMMARQGVRTGSGGGMTMKMCMTKDMVERNQVAQQQQGDCKTTVQPRSGNTMKMSFSCATPPSTGEGQVTFASSEAYSMKMTVNTTAAGQAQKVDMDTSARWVGADCGNIKPH